MKKILVPTDFGEQSEIALDFAQQIANQTKAKITLLHVMNFPSQSESMVDYGNSESWERIVRLEKSELKEKMEVLYDKNGSKDLINKVLIGSVIEEILHFQNQGKFDLLILGAKKTQGLGAYLFGTFTDRIVHKSTIPVLVVKQKTEFRSIKKVIFGNAYKLEQKDLPEDIAIITLLFDDAKIDLVRVNTPDDFMSEDVFDQRVKKLKEMNVLKDCRFHSINHSNPGNGLIYYASKTKSNMIVIGDKHGSLIRRWIIGEDLAEHVMDFSNIPVLIL